MFSFGFGDVIDRLEKHFGSPITKVVLGTLTVLLLIFLFGLVVREVVDPFAKWLGGVVSGNPALADAREGVGTIAWAVWIASVAALVASYSQIKGYFFMLPRALEDAKSVHEEAGKVVAEAKSIVEETNALYDRLVTKAEALGIDLDHTVVGEIAPSDKPRKKA